MLSLQKLKSVEVFQLLFFTPATSGMRSDADHNSDACPENALIQRPKTISGCHIKAKCISYANVLAIRNLEFAMTHRMWIEVDK